MDENKEVVVQNLETLLRSTRGYYNIHLEYHVQSVNDHVIYEYVVITYDNRDYVDKVNVTADSGFAIIKDVMRKL